MRRAATPSKRHAFFSVRPGRPAPSAAPTRHLVGSAAVAGGRRGRPHGSRRFRSSTTGRHRVCLRHIDSERNLLNLPASNALGRLNSRPGHRAGVYPVPTVFGRVSFLLGPCPADLRQHRFSRKLLAHFRCRWCRRSGGSLPSYQDTSGFLPIFVLFSGVTPDGRCNACQWSYWTVRPMSLVEMMTVGQHLFLHPRGFLLVQ